MKRSLMLKFQYFARVAHSKRVPIIPKVIQDINRILFSCDIPYTVELDETVQFGHNGLGVVVHPKTKIGRNSLIMQNVTLGGNLYKKKIYNGVEISYPIIGENVFIGPGAKILGPVIIGDNAQIGANSVVLNDVPRNGVAAGIPAKTLKSLDESEILVINLKSK